MWELFKTPDSSFGPGLVLVVADSASAGGCFCRIVYPEAIQVHGADAYTVKQPYSVLIGTSPNYYSGIKLAREILCPSGRVVYANRLTYFSGSQFDRLSDGQFAGIEHAENTVGVHELVLKGLSKIGLDDADQHCMLETLRQGALFIGRIHMLEVAEVAVAV